MKSIYYFVTFIFCLPTFIYAQNESLDKLINHIIKKEINFDEIPGLVIGVIDADSTYVYGFGETKKGNEQQPDGNTIYEIGSVTKVFTASLLTLLEDEELLNYKDTIGQYFPELKQPITLHDLVTHSSGFPRLPHNLGTKEQDANQPYANYLNEDLLDFLQNYILTKPAGTEYDYSHCGYALLTQIIESTTGKKYEQILQDKLLNSLKMNDTRIILDKEQQERFAQGHSLINEVPAWQFSSFEGAFALKSSVNDLLRFLSMHLRDHHTNLENTLRTNLDKQLLTTRYDVHIGRGWHIIRTRKRFPDVYVHSGVTSGFNSYISFVPETHTAVVVLANSKKSISEIGMVLLETINFNWKMKKKRGA